MAKGTVWYKTRLCSLPKYKGPVPEDGKTTASYWKYHMLLIFTFSTDKPTPCLLPPSPPKQLSSCSREIRLQHTSYIGIFNPNGWRLVISRQKHVFTSGSQACSSCGKWSSRGLCDWPPARPPALLVPGTKSCFPVPKAAQSWFAPEVWALPTTTTPQPPPRHSLVSSQHSCMCSRLSCSQLNERLNWWVLLPSLVH